MPPPSFPALYLAFPIVLGVHNLHEYTHAERRFANPVAVLNYTTHTEALAIVAQLSVTTLAIMTRESGKAALALWPLAAGGLIALPQQFSLRLPSQRCTQAHLTSLKQGYRGPPRAKSISTTALPPGGPPSQVFWGGALSAAGSPRCLYGALS